jgi:hypothetical protein
MTGRLIQFFGSAGEILQEEGGDGGDERRFRAGSESEFDSSIGSDAGGKIERRGIIEGNSDSAAQEAAPEGGHPFRGVSAPEENAVASSNATFFQLESAEDGIPGELLVSPSFAAIAASLNDGDPAGEASEFIEKGKKVGAGHCSDALHAERNHHTPEAAKGGCHSG